ncbi:MAG TPA: hypothetical protein VJ440_01155 [Candidatus Brocadiaceae bacterium]|nr:hypothetical protein [Candidatus Brocadiaceae bacterium]
MIITVLDAIGIQDYIFGSNKLKDNIGASGLVYMALNCWPIETLQKEFPGRVNPSCGYQPDVSCSIIKNNGQFDAELFYAGGGNTVLFFKNRDCARKFALAYSIRLLADAPGLRVECIHHEMEKDLATALEDAFLALGRRKSAHKSGAPLLGLGVTLPCSITKLPANCHDSQEKDTPVSNEIAIKRSGKILQWAKERFEKLSPSITAQINVSGNITVGPFCMPKDFDDLGRTHGETSYIGVVHIDGNGMAGKIAALADQYRDPLRNDEYRKKMFGLSKEIEGVGVHTITTATEWLLRSLSLPDKDDECFFANVVKLEKAKDEKGYNLPIRFLVYGGDDITFVCDGRLAVDLAAFMLKAFQEQKDGYYACAGVAIVKSHYPFASAYKMAEELCRSAKQFVKGQFGNGDASAIDWQITTGGVQTHTENIRKKEYKTAGGESLTLRPYIIPKNGIAIPDGRNWQWFRNDILDTLINPKGDWASHRSKLRELATFIREGKDTLREKLKKLEVKGMRLPPDDKNWNTDGFYHSATPYLDALELLDMAPYSPYWTKKGGA